MIGLLSQIQIHAPKTPILHHCAQGIVLIRAWRVSSHIPLVVSCDASMINERRRFGDICVL